MKVALSIILLFLTGVSYGLEIKSLQVPNSVTPGSTVRLECLFDLEQYELVSVKWFKDNVEFFRHIPRDNPSNQIFPITNIEVDPGRSSEGIVYLKNISPSAEGIYRCDVSARSPVSFRTVSQEKYMFVDGGRAHLKSLSSAGPVASWLLLLILFLCH